jgi:hypothetical protein
MRGDADTLRLKWEGLEAPERAPAVADHLPDGDETLTDPMRFGNVRRSLVPPRK